MDERRGHWTPFFRLHEPGRANNLVEWTWSFSVATSSRLAMDAPDVHHLYPLEGKAITIQLAAKRHRVFVPRDCSHRGEQPWSLQHQEGLLAGRQTNCESILEKWWSL